VILDILLVVAAVLIQPLLVYVVGLLWPTRDHPYTAQRQQQLRERFQRSLDWASDVATTAALILAVLTPVAAYQVARGIALTRSAVGPGVFLYFGFTYLMIPLFVGGYLLGVASGPTIIRLRYRGEERNTVLYLYSLGEREEGRLGRTLVRRASRLAMACLLVPLAIAGNRYTVVGAKGIELTSRARARLACDDPSPRGRMAAPGHSHAARCRRPLPARPAGGQAARTRGAVR
jgi:hypothetical protein